MSYDWFDCDEPARYSMCLITMLKKQVTPQDCDGARDIKTISTSTDDRTLSNGSIIAVEKMIKVRERKPTND